MYWADITYNKIQRASLDGTGVEDLVIMSWPDNALSIALDVGAGKMYWTNNGGTNKIHRANLDGSNVETLLTSVPSAYIALDVAQGKMYWTNGGGHKIQRADLDGSNIEDVVTGLSSPIGLALDVPGGKIYWTDTTYNKIQRANLNGTGVEDLISPGMYLHGMSLGPVPEPVCISKPIADLDDDCKVDFNDFAILANQWLEPPGTPSADIALGGGDGIVNSLDLDLLVLEWLTCNLDPPEACW